MNALNQIRVSVLLAILAQAGIAEGQDNEAVLNVFAGVEYSDNLSRSSGLIFDGEQEETVYKGGLDFGFSSRSSAYKLSADGSVERRQYENGIFDDETIGRLVGDLDWTLIEEQLFWNVSANHGQQVIDPFQAITPENREDVTIVSTGPMLTLPIASRTYLNANISQSDIRFEERPLDNTRLQGSLSLERQITPSRTVSLQLGGSQVEYDDDQLIPEIDQLNASIGFVSQSARTDWSIDIGWNYFERSGQDGEGFLLDLEFQRALTESASLSINASSKYSTNGDIFRLDQEIQSSAPTGLMFETDALDIQGFGDVFRNDNVGIVYSQAFGRTTFNLSGTWRAEKYETITDLNREVTTARVSLSRELSQTMTITAFATLSERDYDSGDRADDDSTYGLSFTANLGRKLSLSLGVREQDRDSDDATFDYGETRVDLTVSYAVL